MPTYIIFNNRKKRYEETLNQFYESVTYGTVNAPNVPKAFKAGIEKFQVRQSMIDVVSLKRAPLFQQQMLKKMEEK